MEGPQKPEKVLVVDDDAAVCGVMAALLRQYGYESVAETDARRVMEHLGEGSFDAILLDIVMPGVGGMELIEQIRQDFTSLPILVVSGHGSAETTLAAMRRGATDFITKPVDGSLLDLRIRRAWDLEQARRLANTDGLTGLHNHRYLYQRLLEEVERAERYARPLSLVMADLDRFKRFNDNHGHPWGDEVLIAVSQTLRRISRSSDLVARYGGEEFTLVLPESTPEEAIKVAERARQAVESLEFRIEDAEPLGVTISLGVAAFEPGWSREDLVRAADSALYRAKRAGRNRVCVAGGLDDDGGGEESSLRLAAS